jgi:glycosyltransferase involved in cell wall biosynthesis
MKLTAIILTHNEELHLARCLDSLEGIATALLVVDCFSTDRTVDIARAHGAIVVQHPWVNYATQFNWALDHLPDDSEWILRIDADEVVTQTLAAEIRRRLGTLGAEIAGVYCGRRMTFQGKAIRYGGLFPIRVLRLFRHRQGRCELRWMDEHIKVNGVTTDFRGDLIDDNLNTLSWWIEKHNKYASREAVDLLNLQYGFMPRDTVSSLLSGRQPAVKRWLKEEVYARLPGGSRALLYFLYRYVLRLGFLDGTAGTAFHVLQGFWYRYLVDAKVSEVKRYMRRNDVSVQTAVLNVLGIRV